MTALLPLADALHWLSSGLTDARPVERVPLERAPGRAPAKPVHAGVDLPPAAVAARDGYALAAAASEGASLYAPIRLRPVAGGCRRVGFGDAMPAGMDAVVDAAEVTAEGEDITLHAPLAAGAGVMPAGGEIAGDALLASPERALAATDVALLRAAGHSAVDCCARAVVRLAPARPLATDVTGPLLCAELAAAGALVERMDDAGALAAAASADMTILYGGTGKGPDDATADRLAGSASLFQSGVAMRPGETTLLATVSGRPVIALPGAPWPALAACRQLVTALVREMAGLPAQRARQWPLARKITSALGMAELVPVASGDGTVRSLPRGGRFPPPGMTGVVAVADGSEGFARGETVEVQTVAGACSDE